MTKAHDAIASADHLIRQFNSRDPFDIAKQSGIYIDFQELGTDILGYSMHSYRIPTIVLNLKNDELTNLSICGHELGHCKMHSRFDTNFFNRMGLRPSVGSVEYEANCFMFELLFGNQEISPMNYGAVLSEYGLPGWMHEYFDLIK
ncbi:ImmA/IrrE family metallo-endopeptidase [Lacticaseibacillus saniviri]|nr:ImmA/IrrE family metallo-endopeptidase [Lacticaseibacillus saniviri]